MYSRSENFSLSEARTQWPLLVAILERYVKEERKKQKRQDLQDRWWQFAYRKNALYDSIRMMDSVLVSSQATKYVCFSLVQARQVFDQKAIIVVDRNKTCLALLNSWVHHIWVEFFASTLGETLNYSTGVCFEAFPFPVNLEIAPSLQAVGEIYHAFRAELMIARNEGLTKTYNRFHALGENGADIARLRTLHHEIDVAVLRAYGWEDLADRAAPEFIEQEADEGKAPKTRLDWAPEFKDEVLARLLALNAERAAGELAAGLVPRG